MADNLPKRRWFHLKPSWLILGLLVVECLLFLSERFQWPNWHKDYAVLIAVAAVGVVFVVMLLWLVIALIFRRGFQFSIRSLLILTVAVALPFSWLAVALKAAREQQEVVGEIRKLGGYVVYDSQCEIDGAVYPAEPEGPQEPRWLRTLLGSDFFCEIDDAIYFRPYATDARLEHLKRLTRLKKLILIRSNITDVGLEHLSGLTSLRELDLNGTKVTDAGVKKLQQALPNCRITR
jgi:hypothetical protein